MALMIRSRKGKDGIRHTTLGGSRIRSVALGLQNAVVLDLFVDSHSKAAGVKDREEFLMRLHQNEVADLLATLQDFAAKYVRPA